MNEVVPGPDLQARVQSLAEILLANSPNSLPATRALLAQQNRDSLDCALEAAIKANAGIRQTADFHEGVAAFLEKRKPGWCA